MLFSHFLIIGASFVPAFASPLSIPYYVHEKRSETPRGWLRRDALNRRAVLPMRVALRQENLEKGWQWLKEVSHPDSANYSKHWTAKDVAEAFAPSDDTVAAVKAWLTSASISENRIRLSQGRGFLDFNATVGEAEALLKTKYHIYEHHESEQPHVACDEYSIPSHLTGKIDLVLPTVHFDAKIKPRKLRRDGHRYNKRASTGSHKGIGKPGSPSLPKPGDNINPSEGYIELQDCAKYTVPDCLRALYQFPPNTEANPENSFGIVEYTPQAFVPSDLDMFFRNFSPAQVGNRPIFESIDGGVVQQTNRSFDFNGESDLDLEYAMTLVYPQQVTLYQAGDLVEGAGLNNFLDAIDANYCTYEGGDDPKGDPGYPDPYAGGYEGPENCGGYAATKVISTSYAYSEHDLTPAYAERQCNEYMKLGMMGVSVLFSSGDNGVAGGSTHCINGPGLNATYTNGTSGRFNPSFPGTCPYVTSVGATQVKPNVSIVQALASGMQPEEACETVIYSGGGFSNVFALPEYQASAVQNWFQNFPPPYGADRFNNSQQTRGFPDISANGANYVFAMDGNFSLVYGTSASSPTLGSILTLINQERYNAGKSSIGFINPVAYAHPEVFNDITEGGNPGCGTPGFESAPGWDPVTGLGTPHFPNMLNLWLSLS